MKKDIFLILNNIKRILKSPKNSLHDRTTIIIKKKTKLNNR